MKNVSLDWTAVKPLEHNLNEFISKMNIEGLVLPFPSHWYHIKSEALTYMRTNWVPKSRTSSWTMARTTFFTHSGNTKVGWPPVNWPRPILHPCWRTKWKIYLRQQHQQKRFQYINERFAFARVIQLPKMRSTMDENAIISHEVMLCNHYVKIEKCLGPFFTIENLPLNYIRSHLPT